VISIAPSPSRVVQNSTKRLYSLGLGVVNDSERKKTDPQTWACLLFYLPILVG